MIFSFAKNLRTYRFQLLIAHAGTKTPQQNSSESDSTDSDDHLLRRIVGVFLFLHAQGNENMFCLSSSRKDAFLSSSIVTIRSMWRRIWTQRLELRLVSKFGTEMSTFQKSLEVDTTVLARIDQP